MPPTDMRVREHASEMTKIARGATDIHRVLRSRILTLVVATTVVDVVGTLLMYAFEHGPAPRFATMGDALFWTTSQLTTVSSSLPNPVTTPGRILDVVLELWAISVVAALAASLASFLMARHHAELARRAAAQSE